MREETAQLTASEPSSLRVSRTPSEHGLAALQDRCLRAAWNRTSPHQFFNHLLKTHHPHLEDRLRRVERSIVFVAARHGLAHGITWDLANIIVELADCMRAALANERERLESLSTTQTSSTNIETSDVGLSSRQYRDLFAEQEKLELELQQMFEQINGLLSQKSPSTNRCPTYFSMLNEIAALEVDYHSHCEEQQQFLRQFGFVPSQR